MVDFSLNSTLLRSMPVSIHPSRTQDPAYPSLIVGLSALSLL